MIKKGSVLILYMCELLLFTHPQKPSKQHSFFNAQNALTFRYVSVRLMFRRK